MEFLLDTHCHTIASGHAYSTIMEYAQIASERGLKLIGITDHGPEMPGGPHIYHIINQKVYPRYIHGVEILKGVEANIIDYNGNLDISNDMLEELDIVIASLHTVCIEPGTIEENTKALVKVMENKCVNVIGHSGNPAYPINKEEFVLKAKETDTLIEINNSSFKKSRVGSAENCIEIAKLCKRHKVKVIVGSDSHIAFDIGAFDKVEKIFEDINMPEELVINTCPDKLKLYLENARNSK